LVEEQMVSLIRKAASHTGFAIMKEIAARLTGAGAVGRVALLAHMIRLHGVHIY
jgi:hypothetical protein